MNYEIKKNGFFQREETRDILYRCTCIYLIYFILNKKVSKFGL